MLGVVLLSPDGLVIRLVDLDAATVLFLRGACSALGFIVLIRITSGALSLDDLRSRRGLAIACLAAIGNISFVLSVRGAGAAPALAIIAAGPMFAAVLSRVVLREMAPLRTWVAAGVVFVSVGVIVLTQPSGAQFGGAVAGLVGALGVATLLVVVRHARGISVMSCQAGGAIGFALAALPFATFAGAQATDLALTIAFFTCVLPLALTLILRGPRFLSAPEVSLITLLETILGPAWVWIALGERPPLVTALAGTAIIATLLVHGLLSRRAAAATMPAGAAQASPANP
jgi:drug/metabolite transporter (DMT)-like permease